MEYFPHGDLEDHITRGITEESAKIICAQLLDGLSLMHRVGFYRRTGIDIDVSIRGRWQACRIYLSNEGKPILYRIQGGKYGTF